MRATRLDGPAVPAGCQRRGGGGDRRRLARAGRGGRNEPSRRARRAGERGRRARGGRARPHRRGGRRGVGAQRRGDGVRAAVLHARRRRGRSADGMAISIDVPLFFAPWGGLRIEDGFRSGADGAVPPCPDRRRLPLAALMPIYTALGPIAAESLGRRACTSTSWRTRGSGSRSPAEPNAPEKAAPVSIETVGFLRWNPHSLLDNLVMDDPDIAVSRAPAGGRRGRLRHRRHDEHRPRPPARGTARDRTQVRRPHHGRMRLLRSRLAPRLGRDDAATTSSRRS